MTFLFYPMQELEEGEELSSSKSLSCALARLYHVSGQGAQRVRLFASDMRHLLDEMVEPLLL